MSRFTLKYRILINTPTLLIFLFAALIILSPSTVVCQSSNIGHSPTHNFDKNTYGASTQNWDISQDANGIMYFANNSGLLVFDGHYWTTYAVDNHTIVRSVAVAEDGKIFVGAQGEIGYFSPNNKGELTYTSLNYLLESRDKTYADVWDVEVVGNQVYFQTGQNIFHYNGKTLKVIYVGSSVSHLSQIKEEIYIYDNGKGILKLNKSSLAFESIGQTDYFNSNNIEVNGILHFQKDTFLITTANKGLLLLTKQSIKPWNIPYSNHLIDSRIYCSVRLDKEHFAIGTISKGVFIINKKGQITQHYDRSKGLQINNVLSLYVDSFKNLWAGLDNGIDYIETNSPFAQIYPDNDLKSMGYSINIHNDKIYFGTAIGVFYNDWKTYYPPTQNANFKLLNNTAGQVWKLSQNEDDLFINHHNGIYIVKNERAQKLTARHGAWMQLKLDNGKFLSGHYDGFTLLEKDKTWQQSIDFCYSWRESCRVIVHDAQNKVVWVSHPYRGVFKVTFNDDFTKLIKVDTYNSDHGFPSDFQIYVFKIGDEAVFCSEKGIFSYDNQKDTFVPNERWNDIFGTHIRVKHLVEAPNGDIWYVSDTEIGILKIVDGGVYKKVQKDVFPQFANRLVDGFETIYPYDDNNVFIATEQGFLHYNPTKTLTDSTYNTLIRRVGLITSDSIIYGGFGLQSKQLSEISYYQNNIRFSFSATYFSDIEHTTFQYFLEGYDKDWSVWINKNEVDYTNLPIGKYTFHVRSKNIQGKISEVASYTFTILPPWYASKLAWIIYCLIIGVLFYSLIFIPKKHFEREKAALETEQKQTLLQKDEEYKQIDEKRKTKISQLENEKLELQIQAKNKELASNTMHLVQKSEILQKLKADIKSIAKETKDSQTSNKLRAVIRRISADERLDNDWEQFAQHFDEVHGQFLKRLRQNYPTLTPKDYRLCAYLRMNLTSKEIAPLMNISVRSVEVARYRLRKKLDLDNSVNLVEFILNI